MRQKLYAIDATISAVETLMERHNGEKMLLASREAKNRGSGVEESELAFIPGAGNSYKERTL
jgi:hypothetical protein